MEKLQNNKTGILWADLSPLAFDKWRTDAIRVAIKEGHHGKTSYEMMMAIFGEESSQLNDDHAPKTTASKSPGKRAPPRVSHILYSPYSSPNHNT